MSVRRGDFASNARTQIAAGKIDLYRCRCCGESYLRYMLQPDLRE